MALSEETQSIIDRLKAEGDLIRNSETNSIKTLGIKFDKFSTVFDSISVNISEQTELLRRQAGIVENAEERIKKQEDLDELKRTVPDKTNNTESNNDKAQKEKSNRKLGETIKNAFGSTLKTFRNLAIGGAVAFAGYNIIKGFFDQKTNGGFSAMETNLGNFARGIGDIDFESIKETFNTLKESVNSIAASLVSLTATLDKIMSIGWTEIIDGVLRSIGLLTAYNLSMRVALGLMAGNSITGGRRGLFRGLLRGGLTAAALKGMFGSGDASVIDEVDKNRAGQLTPDQRAALAGTGDYATNKPPSVMSTSPDRPPNISITESADGRFSYRDMDTNRFISHDEARGRLSAAGLGPDGLPQVSTSPYARPSANMGRGDGAAEMSQRLNDRRAGAAMKTSGAQLARKYIPAEVAKISAKAVIGVGAVIGLGFAAYSYYIGDYTSAGLELTSVAVPSFLGGVGIDMAAATTSIFFHVTKDMNGVGSSYNPFNPAHPPLWWEIMKMIAEELDKAMESAYDPHGHRTGTELEARASEMAANERMAGSMNGRPMPSATHNPYTTDQINNPSFAGGYFTGPGNVLMYQPGGGGPAIRAASRPQHEPAFSGDGGLAPTVIIQGGDTTVAPNVNYTHGGNQQSNLSVLNVGGGGGNGPSRLSPFVQ